MQDRGSRRTAPVLALVLALGLALGLGGCVSHRRLAHSAVGFNLAVEEAQNEMLLINTLRASRRWPMYITGIIKVTGSIRTEYTAALDIPFGKKTETNKGNPSATYIVNPTFEVPVLDTQEFMQGFLAPVNVKTLAYYWDLGWPQPLLLHLLVHRARVREETTVELKNEKGEPILNEDGTPKKTVHVVDYYFDNYPDAADETLCEFTISDRLSRPFEPRAFGE